MELLLENIITEIEFEDYNEHDFIEIFFDFFKKFLKDKYGDKLVRAPFSYHLKKDGYEFFKKFDLLDEIGFEEDDDFDDWVENIYATKLAKLGHKIVEKGFEEMPTLKKQEKFTKKYKKLIDSTLENMKLPKHVQLIFKENEPFKVDVEYLVDFISFIKSDGRIRSNHSIQDEFLNYIEKYANVKKGLAGHGYLEINFKEPEFEGYETWLKTEYKPKIYKKIRAISDNIRAIKLEKLRYGVNIKLYFNDFHRNWTIIDQVKKLLYEDLKLNPKLLTVNN